MVKTCQLCNQEFETTSAVAKYCNRELDITCKVCGKVFKGRCNPKQPDVCSRSCSGKVPTLKENVCPICGDKFIPNSARQIYCKHLKPAICPICGKEYQYECYINPDKTCGDKECIYVYAHNQTQQFYLNTTRICEYCGKEFHPTTNTSKYCSGPHYRKCNYCGKLYEFDISTPDYRRTCSYECAEQAKFICGDPFKLEESKKKARETCLKKYGVEHPMKYEPIKKKVSDTYKERTGYSSPMHNPEHRSKIAKSAKISKLEIHVSKLLDQYGIEYEWHKLVSVENDIQHEFDFYIPKYDIFVDCDGLFYHSYLNDPNGKQVLDCYDELRLSVLPKDSKFVLIVEGDEERGIKRITKMISEIDAGIFDYEGEIFNWCRSIEFPYPNYDDKRLKGDYKSLCKYQTQVYKPKARLGESAINHFHKSIFDCHVGNYVNPKAAWYDDNLLKKVILNRLIYINDIDPFKVLRGFNISKICPKVSIFNPVLARYLTAKYLSDFSTVFDPFSGFSGRLLGVSSLGKSYIGQDLNAKAVEESNDIIKFYDIQNCSVICKDIFDSNGEYECLLTCSPYFKKEVYSVETVFKTCDEWIDECLQRFDCKRYVFVVDKTEKYKDYIVEGLQTVSHYAKIGEYVVVIDG